MLDTVRPEGGGGELFLDEGLGPVEDAAGGGDLPAAGVVERQVAVDHVLR